MLRLIALSVLVAVGVQSFELKSISQINHDIKVGINNKAGDVTGSALDALTEIPLIFSQGMSGAGDWLGGIADKVQKVTDAVALKRRKTLLERYNDAVLRKFEDTTLKFPQLVRKYGYPVEEYEVKSDDGYVLTLFRIPHGRSGPTPGVERRAVFLMHGLVDSADDWIILGPGNSLGYILADAGYDVWFGNARGNTYSKKHVQKVPSQIEFWDFSWDEIGRFDLPAMIDFALEKTGQKQVYYVGHSQGTTSFYVMCSMRPEYNAKIRIMYSLAPIAWMSNMVSPMIRLVSPMSKGLDWVTKNMGVGEFLPNNRLLSVAGGIFCKDRAITQDICSNSLFIVCGFDLDQMNTTMLPVIMGHSPSGSSVKQFLHYGQGVVSRDFRRFDHGIIENKKQYGTIVPPSYDLSKITAPVALFYSINDWLSHPKDVTTLSKKLGNMVDMYLVPHPQFNHMDYMWAIDLESLVHRRIVETMTKY